MKLLAILAVVPLCLAAGDTNTTNAAPFGTWIELTDNCRLHVHNWGGERDRCNDTTKEPLGELNGKTCRGIST